MLLEDLQAIQRGVPLSNRIQFTLSAKAIQTLQQDGQDFYLSDSSTSVPLSSLVNHLVVQYHSQAHISIAQQLNQRKKDLEQILSGMSAASRRIAIQKLLENDRLELERWRDELSETIRLSAGAKQRVLIRLSKAAINTLAEHFKKTGPFAEGQYYNNNIGQYLKFLLEEYVRLSSPRREEIFYGQWLDKITTAITNGQELLVALRSTPTVTSVFRPYAVHLDEESRYHYLLGYWDPQGTGRWQTACLRLNSLCKVQCESVRSPLTKTERQKLQRQIAQKGVAYLSGKHTPVTVRVQLTPEGERLYRSIRHMRPAVVTPPGPDRIYPVSCSAYQAKTYFLRFGKDARILEPASLRRQIARFFKGGLEANGELCPPAFSGRKEQTV